MPQKRRIVVIGGGFTGTLTTAHLTALPGFAAGEYSVTLVERAAQAGRGVPYSTPYSCHVLNVAAQGMSPWPEQPDAFVHWLRSQHPEMPVNVETNFALQQSFVPRATYGAYLDTLLRQALERGLQHVHGDAHQLTLEGPVATVSFADGRESLQADRVALCLGHFAPQMPRLHGDACLQYPQWIANPWHWRALEQVDSKAHVLLLGSGLTMVDMVLGLLHRQFTGRMTAVSRHGLAPMPHLLGLAQQPTALPTTQSALALLQALRRAAQACRQQGGDWRQGVDGLRQATPELWRALSLRHQRQILRHLKSYWDVHRHRIAPHVAHTLRRLQDAGRLQIVAARLQRVEMHDRQLHVSLRQRHDAATQSLRVHHLINCTGGHNDWTRSREPLVQSLLAQNLVVPDKHRLGVQASFDGNVLDAAGGKSSVLFTAGPALIGRDFESVAVPELKYQAARLAVALTR